MNITTHFGIYPGILFGIANTSAVYATKTEDDETIVIEEKAFRMYIPFFCISFISDTELFEDED